MKKLLALLTAALMIVLLAVPAAASGTGNPGSRFVRRSHHGGEPTNSTTFDYKTDGKEATGTETQLHKYLVVEKDTVSPAITFSYTVAPGAASAAGTGTLPVYAGIGAPTVANVTFAAGAATTPGATGQPITDTTKLFASADITISFANITFDKPGVYRYILTEANSNTEGVGGVLYDVDAPDGTEGDRIRTIDVYVIDTEGVLSVQGYVSYKGTITGSPAQTYDPNGVAADGYANGSTATDATGLDEKSNQYINQVKTNTMTAKKVIAGNQGDKESKWNIKVDFTNLPTGVNVKYAKIEEKGTAVTNPTYADYTSGTALEYGHLDKYKFIGIPEGASYTVTETDANKEGYTTTYAAQTYTFASDTTIEDKDDAIVTNTRSGQIPTGIALGITGGVVLLALAVVYFVIRRRLSVRDEY